MGRLLRVLAATALALGLFAAPALACGGLVSPNGTVQLGRTTTLAAYHNGIEHYVTQFSFEGAGAAFGSIVPLPAEPTKVIKAGRWTLQRLELEVNPPVLEDAAAGAASAPQALKGVSIVLRAKIAALDVTVVKGGGTAVGNWAREHGFELSPDAPAVLDFYSARSPFFMAVEFNAKRANAIGQQQGQGTPVHVVIPTDRPWVPLRILALGAGKVAPVEADVFLLNDRQPALLPAPKGADATSGLVLRRSEAASTDLLKDLHKDRSMSWLPTTGMWLSFLQLDSKAGNLTYDLAIDPSGAGKPSPVDAGLVSPSAPPAGSNSWVAWVAVLGGVALLLTAIAQRRRFRIAA